MNHCKVTISRQMAVYGHPPSINGRRSRKALRARKRVMADLRRKKSIFRRDPPSRICRAMIHFFIISSYRRCISEVETSSMLCPMFHLWPKGSRMQPERSP